MTYTTLESVLGSTSRLPFDNSDVEAIRHYLKTSNKNGLDVQPHRIFGKEEVREAFNNGLLALTAPSLETDFVFIKIDGGRGLFGKQKSKILSYIGQLNIDQLMPGPSYSGFILALTSINNIYRHTGILRGSAL